MTCWAIMEHAGWSILEHTGRYRSILEDTGPYWDRLSHPGPYWAVLGHTGPYWRILDHTVPHLHSEAKQSPGARDAKTEISHHSLRNNRGSESAC